MKQVMTRFFAILRDALLPKMLSEELSVTPGKLPCY